MEKDENQFVYYCELSEKHNYNEAKEALATYYNIKGVESYREGNYRKARDFFELAASRNNQSAQNNIRYMNDNNK